MTRRDLLKTNLALGLAAATRGSAAVAKPAVVNPLKPPASGSIPVAFVISDGAVMIDFAGPWEVFQDALVITRHENTPVFQLYTVAEKLDPITASAGMKIVPDYTFETAPAPKVVVIPAQQSRSEAMLNWIRKSAGSADVVMSVCTGAFVLAQTGLLKGKPATTHHGAYQSFAMQYQDVNLKRGYRFVESGNIASAGGLSSGIDLALRVVERYYGRTAAEHTALYMEYQGNGWKDSTGADNAIYTSADNAIYTSAAYLKSQVLCPVCGMPVDRDGAPKSEYGGKTYYFCSESDKQTFDAAPARYIPAGR
jgi:YHS domain-containing protein/putative intracellular protease/amidase